MKPRKTEKLQNHISYVYCTYVYIYIHALYNLPTLKLLWDYFKLTLYLPYTYPTLTLTLEPSPKTPRATPKVRGPGPAAGPRTGGGKRNSTREK